MNDQEFPTEWHQKLAPFAGQFTAEIQLLMGPGEPQVITGVMTNGFELNNQFLQQVYAGDASDGPFPDFAGRGYWGYNTATNQYEGFWIDTASTLMMHETGDVDAAGKVWTMVGAFSHPQTGQRLTRKTVITLVDDDHHKMEQFMDGPDGQEMKTMVMNYTRSG